MSVDLVKAGPAGSEGPAGPRHRRRRSMSEPGTWWVALGWVVFVVLTLGSSLAGRTVFAATDLLQQYAPWDPGTTYVLKNFLTRDVVDAVLPSYAQIHDRLFSGDIPSWSSLAGPGQPLMSTPSNTTLAPTVWPYLALPVWYAPAVVKVLQLAVGALGMFLLLRRWGTGRPAALLAGLVYATSGFFVSWADFAQASVASFIPLLFWAVERQLAMADEERSGRWRGVGTVAFLSGGAPLALVVACLLFAGFPAVTGWALYAVGVYALVRVLARGRALRLADALAGVSSAFWLVVGVALTAVQLLPFGAQLGGTDLSYRDGGFDLKLPVVSLITSVLPRVMASNLPPLFSPPDNAIEYNAYIGSAALLFVLVAVVSTRPTRMPRGIFSFLALASALCVVLIWFRVPALAWVGDLPIFSGNPIGRLRAVLFVLLTAMAGLGLDALLSGRRPRSWRLLVAMVVVLAGVGVSGTVGYRRFGAVRGEDVAVGDIAVAAGAVLLVGAAALAARRLLGGRLLLPVTVALVTAQCVMGTGYYWSHVDRSMFYPPRASLDYLLAHQGHERTAGTRSTLRPSVPSLYGIRTLGAHAFVPEDWATLINATAVDGPNFFDTATVSQLPGGSAAQLAAPGLDRLAVRFATLNEREPVVGKQLTGVGLPPAPGSVVATGPKPVTIAPGVPATVAMDPLALRGLALELLAPTPPADDGEELRFTVRDATGALVVTGRRLEVSFGPPGPFQVPLVQPSGTAPGPWTVTIAWDGPAPLQVAGVDGVPRLDAVVPNGDDGLRLVNTEDGLTTYLRTTALPRFRWASQTRVEPDDAKRANLVARTTLPPDEVVLDAPGVEPSGAPATVAVTEDSGDTVRARVDARGTGYLVVADSMPKADWSATVDGVSTPLVVADEALSAVVVPAGAHDVAIRYAPKGRPLGAALSAGAAVVLLLSGLVVVIDRRRRRSA